jgi:hypothetical protein
MLISDTCQDAGTCFSRIEALITVVSFTNPVSLKFLRYCTCGHIVARSFLRIKVRTNFFSNFFLA